VSGTAAYTDDLPEPRDLLHVAVGMSSKAHARIRSIDFTRVLAADGVVDICTARDIPARSSTTKRYSMTTSSSMPATRSSPWPRIPSTVRARPRGW
jgi:xanthine dehydrogenase molybdopterin-binding subunit B